MPTALSQSSKTPLSSALTPVGRPATKGSSTRGNSTRAPRTATANGHKKPSRKKSNSSTPTPTVKVEPVESAREAGLRYVSDDSPGIRRKKAVKGFTYIAPDGTTLRSEATLARIRSLAIPPAYRDVWICPHSNGHLQATGIDARGRKQYRYHPKWHEVRDETKYTRMMAFGAALPRIREATQKHLALPGMPREKILATIVQLLEKTLIRVGNEEYARENKSHGLTTMHNRHVDVHGSHVTFSFKGKSGIKHKIDLNDRRLARILERLTDLPGQELFQYVDERGTPQTLASSDVNVYLKEISGEDFTAKDFRTWAGTVLASLALQEFENVDSEAQAKKNIVSAIEAVAEKLGNTPSVCRKCYVHPAVVDAYLDGSMIETLQQRTAQTLSEELKDLRPEEAAVMGLLQSRLQQEKKAN